MELRKNVKILTVDRAYTPDRWISAQDALRCFARGIVQDSFGDTVMVLHGGVNGKTGKVSTLEVGSILVIDTGNHFVTDFGYAPLDRERLFQRDQHICAYCGGSFREKFLTIEHVVPRGQGGQDRWENVVTACFDCNQRKACRTPQQARMELLYLPYKPNRFESLILENRNILADQMEFLRERVSKDSRFRI